MWRAWNGVIAALLVGACSDDGSVEGASADHTDDDRSLAAIETTVATEDQPAAEPPPTQQLERVRLTASKIADVGMLTAIAWRDGDLYLLTMNNGLFKLEPA